MSMLNNIKIYTSDDIWRHILTDLGATVISDMSVDAVNFDSLDVNMPITIIDLHKLLLTVSDEEYIVQQILGDSKHCSRLQMRIIICLYRSHGMTIPQLKNVLGYAADADTHTVDTAIYNLRKIFGHDFIINNHGVYSLGKL